MHPAAPACPMCREEDVALWTEDMMVVWQKSHMGSRDFTRCQEALGSSSLVKQEELFMLLFSMLGKWTQPFQLKQDACDEQLMSTSVKAKWDQ